MMPHFMKIFIASYLKFTAFSRWDHILHAQILGGFNNMTAVVSAACKKILYALPIN